MGHGHDPGPGAFARLDAARWRGRVGLPRCATASLDERSIELGQLTQVPNGLDIMRQQATLKRRCGDCGLVAGFVDRTSCRRGWDTPCFRRVRAGDGGVIFYFNATIERSHRYTAPGSR